MQIAVAMVFECYFCNVCRYGLHFNHDVNEIITLRFTFWESQFPCKVHCSHGLPVLTKVCPALY